MKRKSFFFYSAASLIGITAVSKLVSGMFRPNAAEKTSPATGSIRIARNPGAVSRKSGQINTREA